MPRLYYRKARTDRWKKGFKTKTDNEQGFIVNYSIPAPPNDREKNDELICKKGEMYYTWHPKGSPWQFSSTKPDLRPQWEKTIENLRNKVSDLEYGSDDDNIDEDEKENNKSELLSEINDLRDDLYSRLDNIPEQLQESSVLSERIEELDSLIEQIN